MATDKSIRLGIEAIDKVSGLKGMITARSRMLTGQIQWALQPKGKGDTMPDAHYLDAVQLGYLGVGLSDKLPAIDDTVTIKLGNRVQDQVSKFSGIVDEETIFLNGCVHFRLVCEERRKEGEPAYSISLSHKRLKFLDKGIAPDFKNVDEEQKPREKTPGGPPRPFVRMRG